MKWFEYANRSLFFTGSVHKHLAPLLNGVSYKEVRVNFLRHVRIRLMRNEKIKTITHVFTADVK
jgi:hypothetical protein